MVLTDNLSDLVLNSTEETIDYIHETKEKRVSKDNGEH